MWIITALMVLSGCARTTGKMTDVDTRLTFKDNTECTFNIYPTVDQESMTGDIKDLTSTTDQNIPVDLKVPLTGGMPVVDVAKKIITGNVEKTIIEETIDAVTDTDPADTLTETVNMVKFLNEDGSPGANGGKVYSWLTRKGEVIKGPAEVVIDGCGTYVIPDPSIKWTPDGNTQNHNQFVYFPGNDPDQDKHPLGLASIVAGPDCQVETTATVRYIGLE